MLPGISGFFGGDQESRSGTPGLTRHGVGQIGEGRIRSEKGKKAVATKDGRVFLRYFRLKWPVTGYRARIESPAVLSRVSHSGMRLGVIDVLDRQRDL